MERNNNVLWAVIGVLVVIIIAVAAFFASRGQAPTASRGTLSEPVTAADWRLGAASSTVTIVEYSDFECPACAAYYPVVKEVLAEYPEITFVYRHFPLAQHRSARLAAIYAEAAGRQGKFWQMHDVLFERQKEWTVNTEKENDPIFMSYAQILGLNTTQLATDIKDQMIANKVTASYAAGSASGVNSTPSFFINGELISNPRSAADFKTLINNVLQNSR